MALALLLRGLLVNLLSASPYAEPVDPFRLAVYTYVSVSHLAFAVWGREEWFCHGRGLKEL